MTIFVSRSQLGISKPSVVVKPNFQTGQIEGVDLKVPAFAGDKRALVLLPPAAENVNNFPVNQDGWREVDVTAALKQKNGPNLAATGGGRFVRIAPQFDYEVSLKLSPSEIQSIADQGAAVVKDTDAGEVALQVAGDNYPLTVGELSGYQDPKTGAPTFKNLPKGKFTF